MVNEGAHWARAVSWGLGETKGGNEQVAVLCDILDEAEQPTGQRITWYGYFTEKTWKRTVESLRHFGWTGNDVENLQGLDANVVQLVVQHEEYQGNWTAKVQWVNARAAGEVSLKTPLTGPKAKAFAQRMRGQILAMESGGSSGHPQAGPTPPRRAPQQQSLRAGGPPEPPPINEDPRYAADDDIPF